MVLVCKLNIISIDGGLEVSVFFKGVGFIWRGEIRGQVVSHRPSVSFGRRLSLGTLSALQYCSYFTECRLGIYMAEIGSNVAFYIA